MQPDQDIDEEVEDERTPAGLIFRWKGRQVELRFADLGPGDDLAARKEVGLPVTSFLDGFGTDSLVVLWWTARRKTGERRLTYAQAEKAAGLLTRADSPLEVEALYDDEPEEDARPEG